MKVSICGKGGCGKSTVTSLLAKALARREKEVLVTVSWEWNFREILPSISAERKPY